MVLTMTTRNMIAILVSIAVLLGVSLGFSKSIAGSGLGEMTTVVLIRHAERDNFFRLTERGREHAKALVDAVGGMDISAILSPDLERNRDTVQPLADHLKIDISIIPRITPQTVDEIVGEILSRHRGKSVLVVGNGSGNLRALHQRLGGEGDGPYQYGDLFIYKIRDKGPVLVIKSRF